VVDHSLLTIPRVFFLATPVAGLTALTDRGRPVPIFRYETVAMLAQGQSTVHIGEEFKASFLLRAEQQFLGNVSADPRLVRVCGPMPGVNCHGWVLTEGQFGVESEYISHILAENGYRPVAAPKLGDLVIYRLHSEIAHSGIVRSIDGGTAVVESKWGPYGVFSHPADCRPYHEYIFYRSHRAGHSLQIRQLGSS